MRPIGRWRHLMSSDVTVAARTGKDSYGKPTYGTAVRYKAHLSRKATLVTMPTQQVVNSGQAVYLDGHPPVQDTDQVTLSTGDVGSTESVYLQPLVLVVERKFDESGPHHTIVRLK